MIDRRHERCPVLCALIVLGALAAPATAQPGPPQITTPIVNGGANLATADQVSVEFEYTHPAAPGVPIPYDRMRVKPPGGNHLQWARYFAANGRNSFMVTLLPGHRDVFSDTVVLAGQSIRSRAFAIGAAPDAAGAAR